LPQLEFTVISIMSSASVLPAAGSTEVIRSRIIEWDSRRGFGYVEQGRRRLFVHHRDFVRQDHRPRLGDLVSFVVGTDGQGRACAKGVEPLKRRGNLRFRHWVGFAVLLSVPALAVSQVPWSPWISLACLVVVSGLCYRAYRVDKDRAQQGLWRTPESSLHVLGFIGGWPGGFLAQRRFRHKTAKPGFQRVFWTIVLIHEAAAIDFLLGWPGSRYLLEVGGELINLLPA